tara:strand:+ start:1180 stop:1830 length:651 start_codon:yes stop_codon:yes gene_type:complete
MGNNDQSKTSMTVPTRESTIQEKLSFIQASFFLKKTGNGNRGAAHWELPEIKKRFAELVKENNLDVSCRIDHDFLKVGEAFVVKAIAIFEDSSSHQMTASFYCLLDNNASMSPPMKTGSTGTYAGRYALCALFNVTDKSIDPESCDYNDGDEVKKALKKEKASKPASDKQMMLIKDSRNAVYLSNEVKEEVEKGLTFDRADQIIKTFPWAKAKAKK